MALPGSGQISLNDIATEFGGSAPHSLSEYHGKGNAPSSGEIQIAADFYGTSNIFTYTIASNTTNVNLRTAATSAGWDGSAILQTTINSGVTVYSTSTGSYAMTIDGGSFPTSSYLINNGTILGAGGGGGSAWSDAYGCDGGNTKTDGASGGPGLLISNPMTINNTNGRISGGGGGGGTGGTYGNWGTGGGGGGGCGNGPGGYSQRAGNGAAGTLTEVVQVEVATITTEMVAHRERGLVRVVQEVVMRQEERQVTPEVVGIQDRVVQVVRQRQEVLTSLGVAMVQLMVHKDKPIYKEYINGIFIQN